jgi:hypothetical protein
MPGSAILTDDPIKGVKKDPTAAMIRTALLLTAGTTEASFVLSNI